MSEDLSKASSQWSAGDTIKYVGDLYRRDAKSGVWWTAIEQMQEVVLPVLVISVGIFCSIASLMTL